MPYSIGAVHAGLSGSGQIALASPVGLKLLVGSFAAGQSHTIGTPAQYFGAGRVTPGNADGWHRAISIRHAAQLVLPLASEFTKLGYDLVGAETLTVTELVAAVPSNNTLQPQDRQPAAWSQFAPAGDVGGTGTTTAWTYTVPAGKLLSLSAASIVYTRQVVATAVAIAQALIYVNGIPLCYVADFKNAVGDVQRAEWGGGPIMLPAGTVVSASHSNPDTGGYRLWWLLAAGFLFNA